ncbi:MAG: hypothetical protein KF760_09735 [Candidatus Eremiobacteraeota bacterium]|nr:hypothetical protein [Candidatus Eremiobacteraeota bacterium]MCW5866310.1 hypothetical protein [Candidatus Eremiobacteraeota bacterium]
MRVGDSGAIQDLRSTGRARRLQEARLEQNRQLSPAQVAGLQKFFQQNLNDISGLRSGAVGNLQRLSEADLARLFPDQADWQAVLRATAPNRNDNGDARQLRSDYRNLLRDLRREETRASNSQQSTRTTADGEVRKSSWRADDADYFRVDVGDQTRLERMGTTVRRTRSQLGSTQVEQFRLDEEGNPSHELLLAYDGSIPQRVIAKPDGSAELQQLIGHDAEGNPIHQDQQLAPGGKHAETKLDSPWWRERNAAEDWEDETTPVRFHPPEAPREPGIGGLSPNQTRVVARHYQEEFAGDLRADARRDPKVGEAIAAFTKRVGEPAPAIPANQVRTDTKDFCSIMDRLFDKLDKDHDGKINMSELKAAMHDAGFKGADAAAVATVYLAVQSEKATRNGFTKDQLAGLKTGEAGAKLNDFMGGIFSLEKDRLNGISRQVFNGEPDPNKVKQGSFGTCYFISALVAKAQADPDGVKKMIKDNGNGTFTVSFPGAKSVTVNAPTDTELLIHADTGDNGMWVTIIEKAFGKMKNDDAFFSKTESMDKVEGDTLAAGINPLTRKGVDTDELIFTLESTTRSKIQKALANHKMITAAINKDLIFTSDAQDGHAYTIIAFDPKTDRVTIRNPWGQGGQRAEPQNSDGTAKDGKMDGVFQLTIKEFDSMFSTIAYEE